MKLRDLLDAHCGACSIRWFDHVSKEWKNYEFINDFGNLLKGYPEEIRDVLDYRVTSIYIGGRTTSKLCICVHEDSI